MAINLDTKKYKIPARARVKPPQTYPPNIKICVNNRIAAVITAGFFLETGCVIY